MKSPLRTITSRTFILAAALSAGLMGCAADSSNTGGDNSKSDEGAFDAGVEGCGDIAENGTCVQNNGIAAVAVCEIEDDGTEAVYFEDCLCGAPCEITVFQGADVAYCGDPQADSDGHCSILDGVEAVVFCNDEGVITRQECPTDCLVEDGINGQAFCR